MAKLVRCRTAGLDCDFIATGESDDEIVKQTGKHLQEVHNIPLEDMINTVRSAIEEM